MPSCLFCESDSTVEQVGIDASRVKCPSCGQYEISGPSRLSFRQGDAAQRRDAAYYLRNGRADDPRLINTDSMLWVIQEGARRRLAADQALRARVVNALQAVDAQWGVRSADAELNSVALHSDVKNLEVTLDPGLDDKGLIDYLATVLRAQ